MQNIEKAKSQILESVNIGALIELYQPKSMQGTSFKKSLSEAFNENKLNTVSSLLNVALSCHEMRHIDENAFDMSETISEKLNSSIKNQLVFCFEQVQQMTSTNLSRNALAKIDSLVAENADVIVGKIRSGALNAYSSFKPIKMLIESVKISTDDQEESGIHEAYRPVSYIETVNDSIFARLGNKVIAMNENGVTVTKSPNTKFSFMTSVVESMKYDTVAEEFTIHHKNLGKFIISETSVKRVPANSEKVNEYADLKNLISDVSLIIESKNNNAFNRAQINEQRQFVDAIIALHENIDKVALLDNSVVVENKKSGEKFAILVHESHAYFGVLQSNKYPNVFQSCANVNEALSLMEKRSGYNAQHFFIKDIAIFESANKQKSKEIEALQQVVETLSAKRDEIKRELHESKNSAKPSAEKQRLLTEAQVQVEALIVEQQNNLAELIAK